MGAAANGQCYGTADQAAAAACATEWPSSLSDGAVIACTEALPGEGTADAYLVLSRTDALGTGATTTHQVAVSFPACNPLERIQDLANVFGLGLAAVAVVWCTKQFVLRLITDR